mmetsp:Transcript_25797/g.77009  ORF Transcript_25797/g.77009 Transcript_25797/m.77009 type:complete len:204 (-) Transcript_25797:215-826(-)
MGSSPPPQLPWSAMQAPWTATWRPWRGRRDRPPGPWTSPACCSRSRGCASSGSRRAGQSPCPTTTPWRRSRPRTRAAASASPCRPGSSRRSVGAPSPGTPAPPTAWPSGSTASPRARCCGAARTAVTLPRACISQPGECGRHTAASASVGFRRACGFWRTGCWCRWCGRRVGPLRAPWAGPAASLHGPRLLRWGTSPARKAPS